MGMGKWWSLDWYHIFGQTQAIQDCHLAVGHGSWTWQGLRCAHSKGCVGNGDVLATESWKSVSFNLQYHGSKFLETSCHLELHFMLRAISYIVYIHWLTIIYAKPLNLIWVGRTQRRSVFMQSNCTVQSAKQCSTTKQANIMHYACHGQCVLHQVVAPIILPLDHVPQPPTVYDQALEVGEFVFLQSQRPTRVDLCSCKLELRPKVMFVLTGPFVGNNQRSNPSTGYKQCKNKCIYIYN